MSRLVVAAAVACATLAIFVACTDGGSCANPGGPVSAQPDTHCVGPDGGAIVQVTSESACHPDAGPDGGATTDYGDTMPNASADDDDCKYHVSWTSSAVCENSGVVFTVVVTKKSDGTPMTGANTEAEVFLNLTHASPTPYVTSTEGPPGTYVTQPVKFDEAGKWTIRFHFREDCLDLTDDSPHGHAAFYVEVP